MTARRLNRAAFVAVLTLFAIFVPAASGGTRPPAGSPDWKAGPIAPVESRWLSDRLLELTFENPRLNPPFAQTHVRILVPRAWSKEPCPPKPAKCTRYPVVYLLHGGGDDASAWTTKQDGYPVTLEQFTADKDAFVVMPDGGGNGTPGGGYSDWYNDGAFGAPQYETYHVVQLVRFMDANFPTRPYRDGRLVAGLSMGGFGAMSYVARHPDLFAGAFSMSGALDTNNPAVWPLADEGVWGPRTSQEVRWRGRNPADLVANLAGVRVWLRTGMGVPGGPAPLDNHPVGLAIEAAVWSMNETFAQAAQAAGVPYTYLKYVQGAHNWWHWHAGFAIAWPEMAQVFATRTATPARFDYRSIEPSFRVWGWHVNAIRDVAEFLTLEDVGRDGLTLPGSGDVQLRTAPVFVPRKRYRITVEGPAGPDARLLAADGAGRLEFTVRLGPSHQLQQYTPEQRAAEAADPGYWQVARVRIERHTG